MCIRKFLQSGNLCNICTIWVLSNRCAIWILSNRWAIWISSNRCAIWISSNRWTIGSWETDENWVLRNRLWQFDEIFWRNLQRRADSFCFWKFTKNCGKMQDHRIYSNIQHNFTKEKTKICISISSTGFSVSTFSRSSKTFSWASSWLSFTFFAFSAFCQMQMIHTLSSFFALQITNQQISQQICFETVHSFTRILVPNPTKPNY